jgi:hypothetical protein
VVDWSQISNSYVNNYIEGIENDNRRFNLTVDQLKGNNDFSIVIDLSEIPKDLELYGRYSA